MKRYDVCVIGAGASGMSAGIAAANRGLSVIMIDKNRKIGRKLYATGNGKCNLANTYLSSDSYYHDPEILKILKDHPYQSVISYMEELGVPCYEKNGYVYPKSDQASTVVWALSDALKGAGVEILTQCEISGLKSISEGFTVLDQAGQTVVSAKTVILSVGGLSAPQLGAALQEETEGLFSSMSLSYRKFRPALCPVHCDGDFSLIAGVRTKTDICLLRTDDQGNDIIIDREVGELQLTKDGLSGIAVFNLTGNIAMNDMPDENYTFRIDLLCDYSCDEICEAWEKLKKTAPYRTLFAFLNGYLNDKLAACFLEHYFNEEAEPKKIKISECNEKDLRSLIQTMKQWNVRVKSLAGFENSQASAGGISLKDINPLTMELKNCKGIYAVGEAVDVLGKCGGYNLTWAFLSGKTAGEQVLSDAYQERKINDPN